MEDSASESSSLDSFDIPNLLPTKEPINAENIHLSPPPFLEAIIDDLHNCTICHQSINNNDK